MTPERFEQVEAIFDEAVDAPAMDRPAILNRLCGEDTSLRMEVERLIAAPDKARGALLDVIENEVRLMADQTALAPPRKVGPYRLEKELGRGGMGVVFLASRDDDEYRSHVAIKLLYRGLETASVIARFRDERQILASLVHPGIVRLLDGGRTEDGLPYLVMEHIDGIPITHWVEQKDLSVRARIELFREVCAAVAHAHQKLVVHRDIKPSNLLVTVDGAPKLLDFGIAKLLDPDGGREAKTRTGMQLLTPEYASPEQVRGEPATIAVDVYALGLALYELLSGVPAQRSRGEGMEALRFVLDTDPPPPSAVAPAAQRRAIVGDLDAITMKALRKDAADRYASVEQLDQDLERYLNGLPVHARTGAFAYRGGKWIRRNRGILAMLLVVFTSLGVATIVSAAQARRADVAAKRAEEEARRAKRRFDDVRRLANAILFDIDEKIAPLEGATEARELMTRQALSYLDALAGEVDDDPALARELAAAYVKVAQIQGSTQIPNLGRPRDGLASSAKAKRILDDLIEKGHGDTPTRWMLVRVLFTMADLRWALLEGAEAKALGTSAIEIVDHLPVDAHFDDRAVAHGYALQISIALLHDGDIQLATRHSRRAAELNERWSRRDPSSLEARYWMGIDRSVEGTVAVLSGDPARGTLEFRAATAIFTELSAAQPDHLPFRRELWFSRTLTALSLSGQGDLKIWLPVTFDWAAAEAELRQTIPLAKRMVERDGHDVRAATQLVASLDELGAVVSRRDPKEALPLFEQARAIFAALPAATRTSEYARQYERSGQCAMAMTLARVGRRADALAAIETGLAIAKLDATAAASLYDRASPAMCRFQGAQSQHALGDDSAAIEMLQAAASDLRSLCAEKPSAILPYLGLVETLSLEASLRPADHCEMLAEAIAVWRSWPGVPTPYTHARQAQLTDLASDCPPK